MNGVCVLSTFFALLLVVSTTGCKPHHREPTKVELAVLAASSLTEAFQDLERGFESDHPNVDVKLTFAGSQVLRLQIEQGATVDVFASANESHMQSLVASGHIAAPRLFARNELVVIVPPSNPAGIDAFADLGKASRIVIGTDSVPVGIYTRQVLDRATGELGDEFVAGVRRHVVSEENNVRLVRAKVEMGEAEAAVVYRTDAASSDRVRVVSIPSALNVRASYPIGTGVRAPHRREAEEFVAFVISATGREMLRRRGFVTEEE
jgi:molybdate transport system substrate-binding protein